MKKLFGLFVVFALLATIQMPVFSWGRELDIYSVSASTYAPTDAVFQATEVSGDVRIHHILIPNSDASVAQTVTFYKLSDSTTTVTAAFSVDIASTAATGFIAPVQIPFPIPESPAVIHDLSIRKSDTASTVRVTVFYR